MYSSFEGLFVHDIYQEKSVEWAINIYFRIRTQRYKLTVVEKNGTFVPDDVIHLTDRKCVACNRKDPKYKNCNKLSRSRLNPFFHHLISHPSIRLEWLYIPHEEEVDA